VATGEATYGEFPDKILSFISSGNNSESATPEVALRKLPCSRKQSEFKTAG